MASSREIERTAAAWLARRDAGRWSARDQEQLDAWLGAATAHRVAFVRLDAAWLSSGRLKALGAGQPGDTIPARGAWSPSRFATAGKSPAARATPRHHAGSASPTNPSFTARRGAPVKPRRQRRLQLGMLGTVALVAALVLGWQHYGVTEQASFQTATGELRQVPLADGSTAILSSDSRIVVTLSRGERDVDLRRGEAFFTVAKDPHRPFVVSTNGSRVTAVGTRFAVRRDQTGVRVVVTQGVVRLEPESHPDGRRQPITLLPAGSVAQANDSGVVVHSDSVQQAEEFLSWRSGFVSFHDTPLSVAVAEFNRYNSRKIVLGDAAMGSMRVGGNFRWANTGAFVRLLEQGFPIRAERRQGDIVLYRR